ncbi:hypothetical protein BLA18112_06120 [Burkholderia lata]|uniref:Uncharacterized protein n=1 Tax=Burkholderia lata (strain ATCC 17760 / DSM 23089 / LMG 22485 / NCIMB 9086 / R18194 / 383) TaxID=482957 RepID=A0A6P2ZBX5_BURL3|nr:hypothetical protein BLA18112_06120 [Burkholderia lata]
MEETGPAALAWLPQSCCFDFYDCATVAAYGDGETRLKTTAQNKSATERTPWRFFFPATRRHGLRVAKRA